MKRARPERPPGSSRTLHRRWLLAGLVVASLLAFDWSRPAAEQLTARLELGAIRRYQLWISPWLQQGGVRCRFTLSCSHYAAAVVRRDGFVKGNFRALGRLVRCGPWTAAGTADPP